jgi:predicted ABC-type ATPase
MSSPTLYIIAGANGSGKTTFALDYTRRHYLPFINADELAKSIAKSTNQDDLEKVRIKAGRLFFKELEFYLLSGKSFAIESTLSGQYLKNIIIQARSEGYQIHLLFVYLDDASPETNIQRVATRVLSGGHGVPTEGIIRRFYRSKELFFRIYQDLCDKWMLYCNSDATFEEIAYGEGESITVLNPLFFERFSKGVRHDI